VIWPLFKSFADVFRSSDLSGFAKTLWIIFVIVLPFIGVFVRVILTDAEFAAKKQQLLA
jgi:hypothetical protein